MVDNETTSKEKRSSLNRIMAGFDDFDYRVITQIAKYRNVSLSEVVRTTVHKWIENNPDTLKTNYVIDPSKVAREIKQESYEISVDKSLKPYEQEIINELPDFFELVENISVKDFAEHFGIDPKVIKSLFYTHGKEIKKLGLKIILKGDLITIIDS